MNKPEKITNSYKLEGGGYTPRVILRFIDGSTITDRTLSWRKIFNTKEEADKYALFQAELYIKKINETIKKFRLKR